MQWRKIISLWRFELDAKSGPLEAGDFGEIGDFGKNPHAYNGENGKKSSASGDLNWMPKVAPWRLAILAKMAILAKLAILAKKSLEGWRHVTKYSNWTSRNACNGENGETGEKSPASGDLNWMPKVASWRLAILVKLRYVAKYSNWMPKVAPSK